MKCLQWFYRIRKECHGFRWDVPLNNGRRKDLMDFTDSFIVLSEQGGVEGKQSVQCVFKWLPLKNIQRSGKYHRLFPYLSLKATANDCFLLCVNLMINVFISWLMVWSVKCQKIKTNILDSGVFKRLVGTAPNPKGFKLKIVKQRKIQTGTCLKLYQKNVFCQFLN